MSENDWQQHGVCRSLTAEQIDKWFFPQRGESYGAGRIICAQCPVRDECLDHALTRREQWGLWGGKSPRQRRAMTRKIFLQKAS
jgi:WhiB family redox-sensing transcriptional regulator